MMEGIASVFTSLVMRYTRDPAQAERLWQEIAQQYTRKRRHYHTLTHLEQMLGMLVPIRGQVQDWDVLLFALFYHDVIYVAVRTDNEARSAAFAAQRLRVLGLPADRIEACIRHIAATKKHELSPYADINWLMDADLAVLGQEKEGYRRYMQQVRKEYALIPDFLYRPARRKVLVHFLEMEQIFKTPYFRELLEKKARKNLQEELADGG